jgi:hypothetical protein
MPDAVFTTEDTEAKRELSFRFCESCAVAFPLCASVSSVVNIYKRKHLQTTMETQPGRPEPRLHHRPTLLESF